MIFRQLTDKPWESVPGGIDDRYRGGVASLPAATLGLRFFMAVVTVLFLLLILAYKLRMSMEVWRPAPEPWLMWLNSALLILSSVSMQWAVVTTRRGDVSGLRVGLIAGGFFAFAFLAGQIVAWRQLGSLERFDVTNPAIGFFYMITALHALHLAGGILVWGWTMLKTRGDCEVAQFRQTVELCTIYWHFLLLVWLVLFGLLFSGGGNLGSAIQ